MRIRTAVMAAMLMVFGVTPAQGGPPEVVELNLVHIRGDVEHEIVVFWNITRADLCSWVEGGFVGDRPVEALLPVSFKETGKGALVTTIRAERVTEIWHMADPEADNACSATAGESGPLATGRGLFLYSDNDFDVSGTRANAFGATLQSSLSGADGLTWHYSWVFRGLIDLSGDFMPQGTVQLFQTP
jgi:hypothetical protein